MNLPKIIAVVGTTASGKSDLALALAKKFNGEIISVDSRQIYKQMDIGTNKEPGQHQTDTREITKDKHFFAIEQKLDETRSPISLEEALENVYEVQGIPHYMIGVVRPDQLLTLSHFQQLAFGIIQEIIQRGKLPILVGGTSLYTSAILENWQIPDVEPNPNLRRELEDLTDAQLIARLEQTDPKAALRIDVQNRRRVIRAVEIASQGRMLKSASKLAKKYDALYLAPCVSSPFPPAPFPRREGGECVDREVLYQRIDARVDKMIDAGLVEEVRAVGEKYGYDIVAMTGHAYQQIGFYLQGKWTLEQAIEESKKVTRNYAKRQLTWWRKHGDVKWVNNVAEAKNFVEVFLQKAEKVKSLKSEKASDFLLE